jgi:ribosomal protein S18 acetylase RimI-like enzyme
MAEFFASLSKREMARDVSRMLNEFNRLYVRHDADSIMSSATDYFVEINNGRVIGCAGLLKKEKTLSEIKHLCVSPAYKRHGIGRKLALLAIANCDTDYVCMNVREDNVPSLKLAQSLGFVYVTKRWNKDHHVITVGRKTKP